MVRRCEVELRSRSGKTRSSPAIVKVPLATWKVEGADEPECTCQISSRLVLQARYEQYCTCEGRCMSASVTVIVGMRNRMESRVDVGKTEVDVLAVRTVTKMLRCLRMMCLKVVSAQYHTEGAQ